jgi:hypothetical protein
LTEAFVQHSSLYNRALLASRLAADQGFTATSQAFLELAKEFEPSGDGSFQPARSNSDEEQVVVTVDVVPVHSFETLIWG